MNDTNALIEDLDASIGGGVAWTRSRIVLLRCFVMGASFRNVREILELAGCDLCSRSGRN